MKEAMLYDKLPDSRVRRDLCAHRCVIAPDKKGICRVRENQGGTLYTLVCGRVITQRLDPVEKKPLFTDDPAELREAARFVAQELGEKEISGTAAISMKDGENGEPKPSFRGRNMVYYQ
jgi:hypothetical protein